MPLFLTSMSGKDNTTTVLVMTGTPVPSLLCRMIAFGNCLRRAKPGNFCFENLQHQSVCRRLWPIKKRLPAKSSVKSLGSVVLQVFFPVVVHITSSSRFVGWEICQTMTSNQVALPIFRGKALSKYRSSCKEEFWRPIFDCSSIILDGKMM